MAILDRRAQAARIEMLGLSPRFDDLNEDLRQLGIEEFRASVRQQLAPLDAERFMSSATTVTG
jgi:hypothetical protein